MSVSRVKPCAQCPWRLSNQGKKHQFGFYTKTNLRRLWNQVRDGERAQSCHLTDPSHPDHIAVGAKEGATAQECPGSVILVQRELRRMADVQGNVEPEGLERYKRTRKGGLTTSGLRYWLLERIAFANLPRMLGGCGPMPDVDIDDKEIGLPPWLEGQG